MGKKLLPPGFRFHPTDVELVKYYLKRKVLGKKFRFEAIAEVDIYKHAPWELPDRSCLRTGDLKWYFFCPREKKYSSGIRVKRATDLGYWKTTGKDRPVRYNDKVVGMIKTLVFHRGKAPKGDRTDWVMYEYRLEEEELSNRGVAQDAYVLCSIFKKDGPGPRNGAQYGAPFKEEDWDDDDGDGDVEVVNAVEAVSCADVAAPMPINQSNSIVACQSEALPSASNPVAVVAPSEPHESENDDIMELLANFADSPLTLVENDMNEVYNLNHDEMVDNHSNGGNNEAASCSDGFDVYNDLGDLDNLGGFNEHENGISKYTMGDILWGGNGQYLELMDLDFPLNCHTDAGGYEQVQASGFSVTNPSSSTELVPGSSALGKENSVLLNGDQGYQDYEAASFNGDASFCQTFKMGSGQVLQPVRRGKQRNTYSILRYPLESVLASAAEHSASIIGAKISKGSALLSPDVVSSIHVKAEVTLRTDRCTNDALSDKLEESLCIFSDVCNVPKQESLGFLSCLFGVISFLFLGILDLCYLKPISPNIFPVMLFGILHGSSAAIFEYSM